MTTGSAIVIRGDARTLPLPDESVDLIVTSPPYFGLRSYTDDGAHYDGQIGSEPTPQEFLEALWTVTAECWRVLKPSGSMFVNLGDKRSGSSGPGTTSGLGGVPQGGRTGMTSAMKDRSHAQARDDLREEQGRLSHIGDLEGAGEGRTVWKTRMYNQAAFGRAKSKMLLPHRYAIGCEDGAADPGGVGWIVRQDIVWSKPNGLPQSVRDRTRDSHEYWFHLTKNGDYFSAVDEIREPHTGGTHPAGPNAAVTKWESGNGATHRTGVSDPELFDPRGKIPSSVWRIATEPLTVPKWLDVEHFAAFPSEWPRRLIVGWSPNGICLECGEGRRPAVDTAQEVSRLRNSDKLHKQDTRGHHGGFNGAGYPVTTSSTTIVGYVCACTPYTDHPRKGGGMFGNAERRAEGPTGKRHDTPERGPGRVYHLEGWDAPPTRPAVILDPFGGTGTTAMVARALGRIGITVDMSADYGRLARWRIFQSGHGAKIESRTNADRQGTFAL